MLKKLVDAVIGTRHERDVKKLRPIVEQIHEHEARLGELDDAAIQAQTARFRGVLAEKAGALGEEVARLREARRTELDAAERHRLEEELHRAEAAWKAALAAALDELLPEAFATVREACRRLQGTAVPVVGHELTWDMVPYDVQLMGGIVLHQGKIAEMATGEGKTLVATLPLYLNALTGRGTHLVTVNNYLARRDSQWMGHLYRWLGLTVACLDDTQPGTPERQAAYAADITYGTNNEFGFDYLRDNMVFAAQQRVQREHVYAIIDEVDSILIDEARTPLIISGPVGGEENDKYAQYNRQVAELFRKQTAVVNSLMAEAERELADDATRDTGAIKMYQAHLGMPKNKRLLKLLGEPGMQQLRQKMELDALADRKLPARQQRFRELEDVLYFVLDERGHSVHLTDRGAEALSPNDPQLFVVPDISEAVHAIERDPNLDAAARLARRQEVEAAYAAKSEKLHIIHKLLQAYVLYEKDVEYLVQDGQVVIVDEYTGRLMPGRRWSDGLHQAVEAKEGVQVKGETQTLATVTIQNYFRMYEKLSGMTGTAETEENEFFQIYGLEVAVIPTHRPIRRDDRPDVIYRTRREKYNALVDEVERLHQLALPILIGTVNVEVSETLSKMLKRRGLRHEVLNAKHHQREAEIVSQAGQPGAITIATNMAGRGTDIKLGRELDLTAEEAGLQIVGTERHESRRIDRQLRGRSGRQGDPGASRFFLSLEDDLMRLFGGTERISRWMEKGAEEGEVITGKLITRAIEQAQRRVELQNFQSRKRLLEYDDVMNQQREVVYSLRHYPLEGGEDLRGEARRMVDDAAERVVRTWVADFDRPEEWDREALRTKLALDFLLPVDAVSDVAATPDEESLVRAVHEAAGEAMDRKLAYLRDIGARIGVATVEDQVLAQVMLGVLDEKWKDHLYDLDLLRNAIHYRSYGQKDPLVEYKKEAFEMFEDLMRDLSATFAERFLKVQVSTEPPRQRPAPPPPRRTVSDDLFPGEARRPAPGTAPSAAPAVAGAATGTVPEVGRNDPCPCGSGKKYKKCHGATR